MNNSKRFFFSLLLSVALSGSCPLLGFDDRADTEESERLPLWHPIHVEEESRFLFSAFEEAAFIREKLGQWLPRRFLPIEPNDELFWTLESTVIADEEMLVSVTIWNKTQGVSNSFYWSFSLYSSKLSRHYDEVRLVNLADNTGFLIEFPESEESRQVCFLTVASVEEAKKKFSISRANIMWSWRVFRW